MPNRPEKHEPYPRRPGQAKQDYDRGRRAMTPELARAKKIRSSARWQATSQGYLRKHPLCANPLGLHDAVEAATEVHHVQPLAMHPELAFVRDNLRGLCVACHREVERLERANVETRHLFEEAFDGDV